MTYIINDKCILCGSCEIECPTKAISEENKKYMVSSDTCTDCGKCAEVCPVDACQPVA